MTAPYGGINIKRTILLSLGIYQRLNNGISAGLTFEGIVVALLARNNPLAVPAMALMYAYLGVGAQFMQNDAGVSLEVVRVIQAIIILLFTAEGLTKFLRWRRQARTAREAPAA